MAAFEWIQGVVSVRTFLVVFYLAFTGLAWADGVERPALRAAHFEPPSREGRIDINTADAASLSRHLKGVGEKKAKAIVDYRQEHGPFRALRDLEQVKGVGPALVRKNRHLILVGD